MKNQLICKLNLGILMLSLCTLSQAGSLDKAINAPSESEFLRAAGPEWQRTAASTYQAHDGKQTVTVSFGREGYQKDLSELQAHRERIATNLSQTKDPTQRQVLKSSLNELDNALDGVLRLGQAAGADAKAGQTEGNITLTGCGMHTDIHTEFQVFPSIIVGFESRIEAAAGGNSIFASMGNLQLTAIANDTVNTTTGAMTIFYGLGSHIETSASGGDWDCTLETRASLSSTCSNYSGYRNVVWSTNCTAVLNDVPPSVLRR